MAICMTSSAHAHVASIAYITLRVKLIRAEMITTTT